MIAIGCDHGGYELKKEIEAYLAAPGSAYRRLRLVMDAIL